MAAPAVVPIYPSTAGWDGVPDGRFDRVIAPEPVPEVKPVPWWLRILFRYLGSPG